MSLHADFDRPRLIFEPFEKLEIESGEFPVHHQTASEKLAEISKIVGKIIFHTVMIGFFVLVGYGFIHGPVAEKSKFDTDKDYQQAIEWVKS